MIGKQSWTCLYFLLFFTVQQQRCDACAWMSSQYKVISNFCLSLLREMDGEIIDTATVKIKFPHPAYDEADKAKAEDKVRFLAEATEQIIILFDAVSRVDEVKWDSRALEDFLNILSSRQLTELKKCTATYAERAGRSSSERKLRKHFRKLKKILKKANYSADSLEQIRNVVQQHLWRMGIIADNVTQK